MKAEWIKLGDEGLYCCSNCKAIAPYYLDKGVIHCWSVLNYCPSCGAEMPKLNVFTEEENECVVGCDGDCESCPLR